MPLSRSNHDRNQVRFRFDRAWHFPIGRQRLWRLLSDTSMFQSWWPWLRSFEPVPIEPGARTSCSIGPPLPYTLDIEVDVQRVAPEQRVEVTISGDVDGPARLELESVPTGSTARLVWDLEVRRPVLRLAARIGRPILQWGHDWVVTNGVEQFRQATVRQAPRSAHEAER